MYKAYTFHDLFPAFNKEENVAFFLGLCIEEICQKKQAGFLQLAHNLNPRTYMVNT